MVCNDIWEEKYNESKKQNKTKPQNEQNLQSNSPAETEAPILPSPSETEAIEDHSAEYVGEWWDANGESCSLDIACEDGIHYFIDINWSDGTKDNTHWSFAGTYDKNQKGITYQGSKNKEHYPQGQDLQITGIYTDGTGLIYIDTEGMLHWDDHTENAGAGCIFQKN